MEKHNIFNILSQTLLLCPITSQNSILPLDFDIYLAHLTFYLGHHLTNSATATAYVTGHDRSLTSKMTGWGAVMTGPDQSRTSKMTGQ